MTTGDDRVSVLEDEDDEEDEEEGLREDTMVGRAGRLLPRRQAVGSPLPMLEGDEMEVEVEDTGRVGMGMDEDI